MATYKGLKQRPNPLQQNRMVGPVAPLIAENTGYRQDRSVPAIHPRDAEAIPLRYSRRAFLSTRKKGISLL